MDALPVVVEVLRGVFDVDPRVRATSADEVTDIVGSLNEWDAELVARALTSAWLVESAEPAQEAMLHALSELSMSRGLPPPVLRQLNVVALSSVPEAHREYLEGIREDSRSE